MHACMHVCTYICIYRALRGLESQALHCYLFYKRHTMYLCIYIYIQREREREVTTHDVSLYIYIERERARARELRGPESRVWRNLKPAQRQAARLRGGAQGDQRRRRRRRTCRLVAPRRPE